MQSVALGFVGLVLLAAGCSGGRGDITVPSGEDGGRGADAGAGLPVSV